MRARIAVLIGSWLIVVSSALATPADPLALSAEYYYSKYDYKQAYQLWSEVLKRQPGNLPAFFRVCELKVMFEGRAACRDLGRTFLKQTAVPLNAEARRSVRDKLDQLQKTFLTDRGQSLYFQAIAKTRKKDCPAALPLLTQSLAFEKGNVRILKEKLRCEKSLGLTDKFYETTKLAYEGDPFDSEINDDLMELHAYQLDFAKVLEMRDADPDANRTPRFRLAAGIALFETGNASEALGELRAFNEQERQVHPIVWLTIGKILAQRPEAGAEAIPYLERFLSSAGRVEKTLIEGWDPYRSAEKTDEAKRLLASLKR